MKDEPRHRIVTILLCDDNMLNRKLICAFLHGLDVQIIETDSGHDCIRIARESVPAVDLILLDISLKDISGIDVLRSIRSGGEERFRQLPVIAYTAHAMESSRREYLAEGFADMLVKPVVKDDLFAVLGKYLPALDLSGKN